MLSRKKDEALKKLPEVLGIQKKKLLIALDQLPYGEAKGFSSEEEKIVKEAVNILYDPSIFPSTNQASDIDSVIKQGKAVLIRNTCFQLETYLNCAKNICNIFYLKKNLYLGQTTRGRSVSIKSMEYVLTHARKFSDPSKTIFKLHTQANLPKQATIDLLNERMIDNVKHSCPLEDRASALIKDLHQAYDEEKFRALNALITSFTMVIARRFIKQKQHDLIKHIYGLLVEAYLTTDDEKTKKNLYDTCIKHMEWYNMDLPNLFIKVLDLCNIGAADLWDALISTTQVKHVELRIYLSLIVFAETYYGLCQAHLQQWFPFQQILSISKKSHSNELDVRICMVLHYLLEMNNKNVCKVNHYTEPIYIDWAQETAAVIMLKITSK